ncbi:1653_t:CDS:2 [Entrophospora sp. SA101]|nr:1653_t:CDS:2 [Entrophospora sp. SA101]CAJ0845824.1 17447_t:CDS:2 [Entrophospora sp. SA101]
MSQAQLAELAIWEKAQFNNTYDNNNPADLSKFELSSDLDTNFDFEAAATTQLRPITINPSSNSSTAVTTPTNFPPIFSASTGTVAIPGNLIDNSNNSSNGSKNISTTQKISLPKSLQASPNTSTATAAPGNTQSNDKSTNNDLESTNSDNAAKLAAEEDKRRRNTAASARFRIKKKLREQALERTAREMTLKAEMLEGKIKELELENKWLRSLIVEKDARLLDVKPVADLDDDVIVPDDKSKNKNNKMVAIEQDYKKLKDDKSFKKVK